MFIPQQHKQGAGASRYKIVHRRRDTDQAALLSKHRQQRTHVTTITTGWLLVLHKHEQLRWQESNEYRLAGVAQGCKCGHNARDTSGRGDNHFTHSAISRKQILGQTTDMVLEPLSLASSLKTRKIFRTQAHLSFTCER